MAMSQKHFEEMATTAAGILIEIRSKDKTLANHLRSDTLDMLVRVIKSGTLVDPNTRFNEARFRRTVWSKVAQHSVD